MWIGDAHTARKVLQRAYKMLNKQSSLGELVKLRLKHGKALGLDSIEICLLRTLLYFSSFFFLFPVAAIDLLQRKILNHPEMPPEDKYKCYEKLGDAFSQEGVFSFALTNYKKMLEVFWSYFKKNNENLCLIGNLCNPNFPVFQDG